MSQGIDVVEAAKIGKRLSKRWPGCTIGRPPGCPHEVRAKDGKLIASHEDLGECLRAADKLAAEKGGSR